MIEYVGPQPPAGIHRYVFTLFRQSKYPINHHQSVPILRLVSLQVTMDLVFLWLLFILFHTRNVSLQACLPTHCYIYIMLKSGLCMYVISSLCVLASLYHKYQVYTTIVGAIILHVLFHVTTRFKNLHIERGIKRAPNKACTATIEEYMYCFHRLFMS